MRTKNHQPNTEQVRWRESVRSMGCVLRFPGQVQIHHPVGQAAKHLKVAIGNWWILPVTEEAHREVERMSKAEQVALFLEVCERYMVEQYGLPFSAEVLLAIVRWRR